MALERHLTLSRQPASLAAEYCNGHKMTALIRLASVVLAPTSALLSLRTEIDFDCVSRVSHALLLLQLGMTGPHQAAMKVGHASNKMKATKDLQRRDAPGVQDQGPTSISISLLLSPSEMTPDQRNLLELPVLRSQQLGKQVQQQGEACESHGLGIPSPQGLERHMEHFRVERRATSVSALPRSQGSPGLAGSPGSRESQLEGTASDRSKIGNVHTKARDLLAAVQLQASMHVNLHQLQVNQRLPNACSEMQ